MEGPPDSPSEEPLWEVIGAVGLRVSFVLKGRRDLGFDAFIYPDG
jgi:hypothetical protein